MDHINTCIIGAGVVGLAVARNLALKGHEVVVLEKYSRIGEGISSRNSEVIHAGIYYPQGSMKAALCVSGNRQLYEYCERHHVGHRRIGKLIVANDTNEHDQLDLIKERGQANGVDDLAFVSKRQLADLEPNVNASLAVLSPSTGIISCAELMRVFLGELESCGGAVAVNTDVERISPTQTGYLVSSTVDGVKYEFSCTNLVNSAGLGAQAVARRIDGFPMMHIPELYLCKGNYFLLHGRSPFNQLIYPLPDPSGAGLGVHATIDLGGQVKFGPDVEYVDVEDYQVTEQALDASYQAIRRYYPALGDGQLMPGYAGIRPKLQGPGAAPQDFVIQGTETHGMPGLVNLFGIESPGLTSSMAIADTVAIGLAGFC